MTAMTAEEKIAFVKKEFVLDSPFFATQLLTLDIREATEAEKEEMLSPTMGTDGHRLVWVREFIDKVDKAKLLWVFAHEILHNVYFHPLRMGSRDRVLWNIACDLAIGSILRETSFAELDGVLIDTKFAGLPAEEIYDRLLRDAKTEYVKGLINQFAKANGGGLVMQPLNEDGSPLLPSQLKMAELDQAAKNASAYQAQARLAGTMPDFMKRLFDLAVPAVNWRERLAEFVSVAMDTDYDWTRPQKRLLPSGYYFPRLHSKALGDIYNLVDVSGSVSDDALTKEITELKGILLAYPSVKLFVSFFDTKSTDFVEITDEEELARLAVVGGGGTDYICAFNKLTEAQSEPVCIIVITDGYCDTFPKDAPEAPILWVLVGAYNRHFKPPFGDVLTISDYQLGG